MDRPLHILNINGNSAESIKTRVSKYKKYISNHIAINPGDICYYLNSDQVDTNYRLSIVGATNEDIIEKLTAFTSNQEQSGELNGVFYGQICKQNKLAFLFTGEGSQYIDMGRQLFETQPVFKKSIMRCDEILKSYINTRIVDVLYPKQGSSSSLDETSFAQPALFALEYSLAKLLISWNILPDIVLGNSLGEYIAACIAGVFSLEDGLKLVANRSRLMETLKTPGKMVTLFVEESQVSEAIKPYKQDVSIAVVNGPEIVVLSGKNDVVDSVISDLNAEDKFTDLKRAHAYHSPLTEPILQEFKKTTSTVSFAQPKIDIISNVTGKIIREEIATPNYWSSHLRNKVKFSKCLETLNKHSANILVEVGPDPVLISLYKCLFSKRSNAPISWQFTKTFFTLKTLKKDAGVVSQLNSDKLLLPLLSMGVMDWKCVLHSLGKLYVRGVPVNWSYFDKFYERGNLDPSILNI